MKRLMAMLVLTLAWATQAAAEGYGGGVAPVTNKQYASECGACHMAYPPGLLPARSWQKLMGGLANHFGDDASLAAETQQALSEYLQLHAADRSDYRRSQKIMRTLGADETPLRITEVPYIQRKHGEIPARYIAGNAQVRSLSNCAACHTSADRGDFSEHGVHIPGMGAWEDDD